MNILVIGGAGFIGSHTVDALLEKGHNVRILDSLEKPVHFKGKPSFLSDDIDFFEGNVLDKDLLKKALKNMNAVFHFAAYQDYALDFSKYFLVNSTGTALLYETIIENKFPIQKVIVASSQAVLGEGRYICTYCNEITGKLKINNLVYEIENSEGEDLDFIYPDIRLDAQLSKGIWDFYCQKCKRKLEVVAADETVINPQNQYAISKYSQELIAINLGKRYSIPTVCLRYSIVQGARQSFYNTYSGAMRIFCLHLFLNKRPTIYEDGKQIRDFINIRDVVNANLLALEKEEANYQVYNIGGGKPYTVKQFYDKVAEIFGKAIEPRIPGEYRYGDTRHIFSDIRKFRKLGWEPKISIEQSITEYKQYLEEQTDIEDIIDYQSKNMRKAGIVRKIEK